MATSKKTAGPAPAAKKRAARKAAPPVKAAPAPAAQPRAARAKEEKPAKVKLVRDSFTIPKTEYAAIDELKKRAARAGLPSKKSEVLRAGLMALSAMGDGAFQAAMSGVPMLKTGRPKKAKAASS
ncbi:hypothetical protein [Ramlibacter albus]|uniref:Uncharacterized protein n=1 Tax=Ramlibacter albus TaxID=2079448 RepID=A0A923S3N8_9BURK|nr:hypothetical protein [Ramlibacter albus]MBC5766640.1 hypothetical protein [Ramlibacter albus]